MLIYSYGINGKKSTAASLPRHKRKQEYSTSNRLQLVCPSLYLHLKRHRPLPIPQLTSQQVAFGEDFHAGGAILRNEGPAVAPLDGHHGAALEDVIHEPLAVAEG